MLDKDHFSQREIEKELHDKLDNISERSLSLLKFTFTIIGVYLLILYNIYQKLDYNSIINSAPNNTYSIYSIMGCFSLIGISIRSSVLPLLTVRHKYIETKESIRYKEGHELEKSNRELGIKIRKNEFHNMIATGALSYSVSFFVCYFVPTKELGGYMFFTIIGLIIASSIKFNDLWSEIEYIEDEGCDIISEFAFINEVKKPWWRFW